VSNRIPASASRLHLIFSLLWSERSDNLIEETIMATVQHNAVSSQPVSAATPLETPEVRLYSHSSLFYWWPVWLIGYIFALLSYLQGQKVTIGNHDVWMHPSKNLGVLYTVVFLLVVLITNVTLRGLMSIVVIVTGLFFTVLFAWLDWWETILGWLPYLAMYMNVGFYVFFSTGLFLCWAAAFFVFDRLNYWRIVPGQMTFERIIGGGERSYDTRGMVFEKHLIDFFRHRILGLGGGDLRIKTSGAHTEEIYIPNVMFVHRKVVEIQKLIAIKPVEEEQVVAVGTPG
jgi:hypothetical protein